MCQPRNVSWVIIEGDWVDNAADHGEPVALDRTLRQLFEFVPKLVPPSFLIRQGAAGDYDGAGGFPHGRVLTCVPLSAI
ncbi:hypothetical protein D3C87_956650 [compost metagenome]